jgi:hypothetical protein
MQLMVRHLEDAGRCDKAKSDQLRAMLKEDPPRYLDVLEDFSKAHSDDRDGYETFLRRHLKPDDLAESDLHKLILRIGFWGIASYNFDLVFEKHFDKQAPLVYPELMEQIGQFQRRGFFAKIHGCISRPASRLVLTKTSYDELRRHPNYSNLLTTVLLAHKVLCVGFSLRDPDFQSILTDLKDHWVENLPPLYALMRDPGEDARSTWLKKGVDILPYADHGEVQAFFQQLAETCKTGHDRAWSAPLGAEPRTAVDRQAKELRELITEWRGKQKIAEMDAVMSRHLSRLPSPAEREASLFRVAAMCRLQERPHLCHHLIAVGTPAYLDLTRQLIPSAAGDDRFYPLSPDRIHVPVHRFIMADPVWEYERDALESLLKWVLDADWSKHGVDLSITFREVLSRVANSPRERRLDSLYRVTEHIPQAAAEIEKIALAPGFVRGHDQVEGS